MKVAMQSYSLLNLRLVSFFTVNDIFLFLWKNRTYYSFLCLWSGCYICKWSISPGFTSLSLSYTMLAVTIKKTKLLEMADSVYFTLPASHNAICSWLWFLSSSFVLAILICIAGEPHLLTWSPHSRNYWESPCMDTVVPSAHIKITPGQKKVKSG